MLLLSRSPPQVQPLIKNIQSNGVIANAKHYVNNNQVRPRKRNKAAKPVSLCYIGGHLSPHVPSPPPPPLHFLRRQTATASLPTSASACASKCTTRLLPALWLPSASFVALRSCLLAPVLPCPAAMSSLCHFFSSVGSFMCSYNLINDRWSCEHADTLGDLKVRPSP